jgi:hypothetical protein
MTDYEKFYWILDMIKSSKDTIKGDLANSLLSQSDLDKLSKIYTLLQPEPIYEVDKENSERFIRWIEDDNNMPPSRFISNEPITYMRLQEALLKNSKIIKYDEKHYNEYYKKAFRISMLTIIDILLRFNQHISRDGKTPPLKPDVIPTLIKKSIYFITYKKYALKYKFSEKVIVSYQSEVIEDIEILSGECVKLGHNAWQDWGLSPEADYIAGAYKEIEMPYNYMGGKDSKTGYLQFMLRSISESVTYSSFWDLFGGGGSCSLARPYNIKVKEFINDFNIRNVMFYMSFRKEHYREFLKACKKLIYEINNPVHDALYDAGKVYWDSYIKSECNKLNVMLRKIKTDENLQYFLANSAIDNIFMSYFRDDSVGMPTLFTPSNIDKYLIDLEKFLQEASSNNDVDDFSFLRFYTYLKGATDKDSKDDFISIKLRLENRAVYNSKNRDKIIYAIGKYYYFEALGSYVEGKQYNNKSSHIKNDHLLPNRYKCLSSSLLAGYTDYSIGAKEDLSDKVLGYDSELALSFFYMQHMTFIGNISVTGVNVDNYNKFEDGVKNLTVVQERMRNIKPLWKDTNDILNQGSELISISKQGNAQKMNQLAFSDEEINKLTRKKINNRAKFTINFYEHSLVYLDSPYIHTKGYAGKVKKQLIDGIEVKSNFDFNKYRTSVNNFIGKYMYSCRFSHNVGKGKIKEAAQVVQRIIKYYRGFTSAKYVCILTDGVSQLYDYIKNNIYNDKLEVIFTNFDFTTPKSMNREEVKEIVYQFDNQPEEKYYKKLEYNEFLDVVENVVEEILASYMQ